MSLSKRARELDGELIVVETDEAELEEKLEKIKAKKLKLRVELSQEQDGIKYTVYPDGYKDERTKSCPTCDGPRTQSCKCKMNDSWCEYGHKWHSHFNEEKQLVIVGCGSQHTSNDGLSCCVYCAE